MFLTKEIIAQIQSNPDYIIQLLQKVQGREAFRELAPYFKMDSTLTSRLLKELVKQDHILLYCAKHSLLEDTTRDFLYVGENRTKTNLLTNILFTILDKNLNPSIEVKNIVIQLHTKFPQIIHDAIEMSSSSWSRKRKQSVASVIEQFTLQIQHKELVILTGGVQGGPEYPLSTQLKDIVNIILFLRDFEKFKSQLNKIEAALVARAGTVTYDKSRHPKLLTGYFKEWGASNGFKGWAKLLRGLESDEFKSLLRDHMLFKDKNFRWQKHGEFSHIIQLICLIEYNNEVKKRGETFLINDPVQLIEWIGQEGLKKEAESSQLVKAVTLLDKISSGEKIWDLVFDQPPGDRYDFGSPETLNTFLTTDDEAKMAFPMFHSLILERGQRPKKSSAERKENVEINLFKKDKGM